MSKVQQGKKPQPIAPRVVKAPSLGKSGPVKYYQNRLYWLIFAVTFLVYGNTVLSDYAVDDAIVITNNDYTLQGFKGIPKILTTDLFVGFFKGNTNNVAGGRYRPLSLITFATEVQFFGQNPHISHFMNIFFFAICGIGIFIFIKKILAASHLKLLEHSAIPLLTTLLFITHPVHTEAVSNIKGRDEIFSLLFSIFSAIYFLKYIDEGNKIKDLLIGVALFFLGLLSKENSIMFILVIPMTLYFFRNATLKEYGMIMTPTAFVTAIFLVIRAKYTPSGINAPIPEIMNNPFVGATDLQKYCTIIYTVGRYFLLMIFPHPLTSDYYFNQIPLKSFSDVGTILSALLIVALAIIAVVQFLKKSILSYSIIFFFLMFALVSNVLFPIGTTMSERFIFIPSLGFCFVTAYYINMLATKGIPKPIINKTYQDILPDWTIIQNKTTMSILVVVLGFFFVKTMSRNLAWKDNTTLFFTDVQVSTNSAKINNACGGTLVDAGKVLKDPKHRLDTINMAKPYLKKAIEVNPKYTEAWLLLGNAYLLGDKQYDSALFCLDNCLRLNPHYGSAVNNLKVLFNEWKNYSKEAEFYEMLAGRTPDNSDFYYQETEAFIKLNNPDQALTAIKKAVASKPDFSAGYALIGMIFGKQKNELDSSLFYLQKAIQVDPQNWEAYENMGVCYGVQKKYYDAIAILQKGIQLNPKYAKFYLNIGVTYNIMGKAAEGKPYIDKAFQLDPNLKK